MEVEVESWVIKRVAAGKRWPLEATDPHLLTDVIKVG